MDYPIWTPRMGGGVLIGIVAIAHVVVSHFAIGGGLVLAVLETRATRLDDRALRDFVRGGSRLLILLSAVFGAVSGVGIWFTIGLVSPGATSALIHNYVWGWAIEWTFFVLEVATALAWYATWDRVRVKTHLALVWIYFAAAFLSLVVIQGILAFMLTPGEWVRTHDFWDGFFNPTYFPGLVLRTGLCLILAGGWLMLIAQRTRDAGARTRIVRQLSVFPLIGSALASGGLLWWRSELPASAQILYVGKSALLASLATTARWVPLAIAAVFLLGLFAWFAPRRHRWPTAILLLLAGAAALGGYERLREGLRKPFVIRDYMFSNGVRVDQLDALNEQGLLANSGWAAREGGGDELAMGQAVFRVACSSCHTQSGYLSIRRILAGADPDRVNGVLGLMRDDGDVWSQARKSGALRADLDQLSYPFMPPLAGTEEEVGALASYLLHEVGVRVAENAGPTPVARTAVGLAVAPAIGSAP